MTEPTVSSQGTGHRYRWKWFLALGALLLLLGIGGVTSSLLDLTFALVFGPMLLASSLLQLMTTFFAGTRRERLPHYLAAGVEMALGFLIMVHPPERVGQLIALVVVFFMVIGLLRLARSLVMQPRRRGWAALAGAIALLVGVSVWVGWPVAKLWIVGLCIAVDFLCHGVSWSALALAERKSVQGPTYCGPQGPHTLRETEGELPPGTPGPNPHSGTERQP
jgi:uncharacterized membrane protein HdeD (DUF308 family)